MKRTTTYSAKTGEIKHKWHLVDAEGKILGRLAVAVAAMIRGKNEPTFTKHIDTGDFVIVINASKIKVTGKKLKDKIYFRHSGYPGGDRYINLEDQLKKDPTKVIQHAVRGMLPMGRLGDQLITKLKVYSDANYVEKAQAPVPAAI
jgi:large subunit ribosomal protein L13